MNGLVFACITPHGLPLIDELSPEGEGTLATRAALTEVGRRCAAAQPDVLIILTPHGTRVDGAMCLAGGGRAAGTLRWNERQIELNVPLDTVLTDRIAAAARIHATPVALAGFGGNQRDQSTNPLDWGTIVPLWFLGYGRNMRGHGDMFGAPPAQDDGPSVVIAAPSRRLPRSAMIAFGEAIAEAVRLDGRRVALVASCDWSHTHAADGPYGYHPAAAEVDAFVVQALRDNDPERLLDLPDDQVEAAAIDGLWQTLILAGALRSFPMRGEVLSYEAPSYYGMLVAAYTPTSEAKPATNN